MTKSQRIVFMGTPVFAVPTLAALADSEHEVVLAVTQPDRPSGRGRRLTPPPVKAVAEGLGLPVLQPRTVNDEKLVQFLEQLAPDYLVVIAYGQMLSKKLLGIPRKGAFNVHASLLPRYRGAAPIQWAIINGEAETGVTTMFMDAGMDTGDILETAVTAISCKDTAQDLHDRLAGIGASLLLKTLRGYESGTLKPIPQDHSQATYASLLTKENGRIDWRRSAREIDCLIRGVTPWPGAFTFFGERRLKIYRACAVEGSVSGPPGSVQKSFPDELLVATGDGQLAIAEIQGASGKRMPAKAFLSGCRLSAGDRFT
jgi:methionyl-tRNA formyltransferase